MYISKGITPYTRHYVNCLRKNCLVIISRKGVIFGEGGGVWKKYKTCPLIVSAMLNFFTGVGSCRNLICNFTKQVLFTSTYYFFSLNSFAVCNSNNSFLVVIFFFFLYEELRPIFFFVEQIAFLKLFLYALTLLFLNFS